MSIDVTGNSGQRFSGSKSVCHVVSLATLASKWLDRSKPVCWLVSLVTQPNSLKARSQSVVLCHWQLKSVVEMVNGSLSCYVTGSLSQWLRRSKPICRVMSLASLVDGFMAILNILR